MTRLHGPKMINPSGAQVLENFGFCETGFFAGFYFPFSMYSTVMKEENAYISKTRQQQLPELYVELCEALVATFMDVCYQNSFGPAATRLTYVFTRSLGNGHAVIDPGSAYGRARTISAPSIMTIKLLGFLLDRTIECVEASAFNLPDKARELAVLDRPVEGRMEGSLRDALDASRLRLASLRDRMREAKGRLEAREVTEEEVKAFREYRHGFNQLLQGLGLGPCTVTATALDDMFQESKARYATLYQVKSWLFRHNFLGRGEHAHLPPANELPAVNLRELLTFSASLERWMGLQPDTLRVLTFFVARNSVLFEAFSHQAFCTQTEDAQEVTLQAADIDAMVHEVSGKLDRLLDSDDMPLTELHVLMEEKLLRKLHRNKTKEIEAISEFRRSFCRIDHEEIERKLTRLHAALDVVQYRSVFESVRKTLKDYGMACVDAPELRQAENLLLSDPPLSQVETLRDEVALALDELTGTMQNWFKREDRSLSLMSSPLLMYRSIAAGVLQDHRRGPPAGGIPEGGE
jgi:hypothetical protein